MTGSEILKARSVRAHLQKAESHMGVRQTDRQVVSAFLDTSLLLRYHALGLPQ